MLEEIYSIMAGMGGFSPKIDGNVKWAGPNDLEKYCLSMIPSLRGFHTGVAAELQPKSVASFPHGHRMENT